MKLNANKQRLILFISIGLLIGLSFVACAAPASPTESATVAPTVTTTSVLSALVVLDTPVRPQSSPYPFTTPLPPSAETELDGVYGKVELREGTPIPCRRCADYLPDGGVWRLWLERGVFRVQFLVTGWRSVGSFTLTDDRITFFNDPTCGSEVGIYEWERKERSLILKVIDDPCMFGLRAANFSNLPWDSCQPPNREAAVTDHWLRPKGC